MSEAGKVAWKSMRWGAAVGVAVLGWGCMGTASGAPSPPAKTTMQTMTISVTVPDGGWRLQIERVLEREDEVWVLARLWREPGPAVQVIRRITAEVPVALPDKARRVFVAGKTWKWPNREPYAFVHSLETVQKEAGDARVLYAGPAAGGSGGQVK